MPSVRRRTFRASQAREAALYWARTPSGFVSPKAAISPKRAWEFIILAVEAADDALVGMTNQLRTMKRLPESA